MNLLICVSMMLLAISNILLWFRDGGIDQMFLFLLAVIAAGVWRDPPTYIR